MNSRSIALLIALLVFCLSGSIRANDWPMWRYDSGRTASVPDASLPDKMHLQWTRVYSQREQVWDDTLNHDLMPYDKIFEPVVANGLMFFGFNDTDKVVALDIETGEEIWAFYTDGPVRFAPVVYKNRVIFSSDDGYLYCVSANRGRLRWKFRGGPSERKAIGNHRVISTWPARGAPVVQDGNVYFAASIWPFMGTFIYSLDAETGEVNWKNDGTAYQYIKQPHSAPSFAGVAPQGAMVVLGDYLLVPGGRSVPAAFDRNTGEFRYFHMNEGGKGNGGSVLMARNDKFFLHTRKRGVRAWNIKDGKKTAWQTNEPVLASDVTYAAEDKKIKARASEKKTFWEFEADGTGDLIQVGGRLYAAGKDEIIAIQIPPRRPEKKEDKDKKKDDEKKDEKKEEGKDDEKESKEDDKEKTEEEKKREAEEKKRKAEEKKKEEERKKKEDEKYSPKIIWRHKVKGKVLRLLAADGMLFAVTLDGRIMAFGEEEIEKPEEIFTESIELTTTSSSRKRATELIKRSTDSTGYVLWYGLDDEELLKAMITESNFKIVGVDLRERRVETLREELDAAGVYGRRITVHQGDPKSFHAPQYMGHLVILGESIEDRVNNEEALRQVYQSVRPYGGAMVALTSIATEFGQQVVDADLEKSQIEKGPDYLMARRVGPLTGSADWTHQYGDVANTVKSNDSRVKLPLGLLWFGGSPNTDVLPRHGHGPPEQVIGGRVIIQGMSSLSARDVYTGRILWKREFEDLGTYDIYFDETYKDTPLDPAYNQVHIPGANGRGTNYVATQDSIYLVIKSKCIVMDAKNGETMFEIMLPQPPTEFDSDWGYVGVYGDILLAGAGFGNYRSRHKLDFSEDKKLSGNGKGYGSKSFDVSSSKSLMGFNRHTGEQLWRVDAVHSFIHNGIVAGHGRVYCLDKLPKQVEDKMKRRGLANPDTYRILAIDYRTGDQAWEVNSGIFGTWLGYSEQYGLLLQAGASASDRLKSEVGEGMSVYKGSDGTEVWRDAKRKYSGPCILHNDTILTNANSYQLSAGAFSLLDGKSKLVYNPLTGEEQEWQLCRAYGCNSIIASENMLTFRSGAAGFYDLETLSGTGNIGGFKSSCTSNLVVANGVLNAPDYTRTCSCAYQNQTSLALVHMPELDVWTVNHEARLSSPGKKLQRVGINFGAPGDRIDENGTLWLDHPKVGGDSADLDIKVEGDKVKYFNSNTTNVSGSGLRWVGASGAEKLSSVSIPLFIKKEPEKVGYPVKDAADDAEEQLDNGEVSTASSDLEFIQDDKKEQVVGIRFADIKIPKKTKIHSAIIQFTVDEPSEGETKLKIAAQDAGSASSFEAKEKNISSRPKLKKQIDWSPKAWKKKDEAGEDHRSPDLKDLVQELVNRDDWASGNALAFIISGKGRRVAHAFGSEKGVPRLILKADLPEEEPKEKLPEFPYTVRLHFVEPEGIAEGERVFDVLLQGKKVLENFDIVKEAGAARKVIRKEFNGVMAGDTIELSFEAHKGNALVSGVEVMLE